ncbi:hypothetical protein GFH48_19735 [Streptomyces fagopyri]|uniref:Uncharacterized protein n=1 Tax=Streptomyces fagopyri TaxID=2662397 RepID=A0A5Q0LE44_9ACTN|nr:hypothetical protein [Streptomyces fagopyri]QFZ75201.1 hypothetical protein GFH48_19735 [Streptomyces fagopyri]
MESIRTRAEVRIEAASQQYARTDPAFLEQVLELRTDLSRAGVEVLDGDGAGKKGIGEIEPVVQAVVFGGPGLVALCGVAKVWLRQRGHRVLRITVRDSVGDEHVVLAEGKNVSDEMLLAFSRDVGKRLG